MDSNVPKCKRMVRGKIEGRRQKAEGREQKAEGREQKSEGRRQAVIKEEKGNGRMEGKCSRDIRI
jgi:hypothetical protein